MILKRRKSRNQLERELDAQKRLCAQKDEKIEQLKTELEAIKKGERCIGRHCEICMNWARPERTIYANNQIQWIEGACKLEAAAKCPDFKAR